MALADSTVEGEAATVAVAEVVDDGLVDMIRRRWRLIFCVAVVVIVLLSWIFASTPMQIGVTLVGFVAILLIVGQRRSGSDEQLPFWKAGSGSGRRSGGGGAGGF